MVIFINDDNDDDNNVCKNHFYTIVFKMTELL